MPLADARIRQHIEQQRQQHPGRGLTRIVPHRADRGDAHHRLSITHPANQCRNREPVRWDAPQHTKRLRPHLRALITRMLAQRIHRRSRPRDARLAPALSCGLGSSTLTWHRPSHGGVGPAIATYCPPPPSALIHSPSPLSTFYSLASPPPSLTVSL